MPIRPDIYLAFAAASALLILMPGPNFSLIVANSLARGVRQGLITVAGTSSAMLVQLSATVFGLSQLLGIFGAWFELLRWLGVAYLAALGMLVWTRRDSREATRQTLKSSPHKAFAAGFFVSLTNPKTLLFYAAFLPQFVIGDSGKTEQLLILAMIFLIIAIVLDTGWALLAHQARRFLERDERTLNRATGGLLIAAAAGLAWARRP